MNEETRAFCEALCKAMAPVLREHKVKLSKYNIYDGCDNCCDTEWEFIPSSIYQNSATVRLSIDDLQTSLDSKLTATVNAKQDYICPVCGEPGSVSDFPYCCTDCANHVGADEPGRTCGDIDRALAAYKKKLDERKNK